MFEKEDSSSSSKEESQTGQINFTGENGKFDKEKFYEYLKTKPKGIQGINNDVERLVLYRARKHQWNTEIKWKRRGKSV